MNNDKKAIPLDRLTMKFTEAAEKLKKTAAKKLAKLFKEKKYARLIEEADDAIKNLPSEPLGEGDKDVSDIYALKASAMAELGKPKEEVLKIAVKALNFDRLNKNALWLVRETKGLYSEKAEYYRLQVEGVAYFLDEKNEEIKQVFRTVYGALADSPEEALEFVKEIEREEVKSELKIIKAVSKGKKEKMPKGVYETTRLFAWYEREN